MRHCLFQNACAECFDCVLPGQIDVRQTVSHIHAPCIMYVLASALFCSVCVNSVCVFFFFYCIAHNSVDYKQFPPFFQRCHRRRRCCLVQFGFRLMIFARNHFFTVNCRAAHNDTQYNRSSSAKGERKKVSTMNLNFHFDRLFSTIFQN